MQDQAQKFLEEARRRGFEPEYLEIYQEQLAKRPNLTPSRFLYSIWESPVSYPDPNKTSSDNEG